MVETEVKCPLRPTLLVISAAQEVDALSLAERAGFRYAENMRRLTEKFSKRHWNITISDITEEHVLGEAWASFEASNMAILTGYRGTPADNAVIEGLAAASNPVTTLINLGYDLRNADLTIFQKAVSLILPLGLGDQFAMTAQILKETRKENSWGAWTTRRERDFAGIPPQAQQKYIN